MSELAGQDRWAAVDDYIAERLLPADAALSAAIQASASAGLPNIQVSAPQGRLLELLVRSIGAERVLEIGTLGGYSALWMARALPAQGRLITLEKDPRFAEVARANIARAGLASKVDVRVGPALETLLKLQAESAGPFDLAFIDADKASNADYVRWALKLARPGALIIVDNVIRDGEVIDAGSADAMVQGARRLFDALANEPRLVATAIQTVGNKGYDGFAIARVTSGS